MILNSILMMFNVKVKKNENLKQKTQKKRKFKSISKIFKEVHNLLKRKIKYKARK